MAGLIGLLNVFLLFGLAYFADGKLKLSPNFVVTAIMLLFAKMLTLLILSPFLPNDLKGVGDYFLGAIAMSVMVGIAGSIPDVFKPGGCASLMR